MTTPSDRRKNRRAEQRATVIEAARALFAARGPEAVTVADVARAAGISRATVFNHFGSKHALLEGITSNVLQEYDTLLGNALDNEQDSIPMLIRGLFEQMGTGIEEQRRFHLAVFREIAKLTLGIDEGGPGQLARQAALRQLVLLLERGQERGELTRDHRVEDLATAFDSMVFGTITHWLYDDASESLRARMLRAAEVFLGSVESPPPDGRGRARLRLVGEEPSG